MEPQKTQKSQSKPEEEKAWDITVYDFKMYHKAAVTKTVWYWKQMYRLMEKNKKPRNKFITTWNLSPSKML